ncbi:MAG: MFS transporter [Candidatus Ratteibacteria bacterium]
MILLLCFTTFLISFALYISNISIPLYIISKFSATPLMLGITGFLSSFFYTLSLFISYKLNFKKHFPWFIFVCLPIGIIYFSMPFLNKFKFFLLFITLNSIFYSRFWPSVQSLFVGINEIDKYNIFWALGVVGGVFISGIFFKINETLPFFVCGVLSSLCFLLNILYFEKFLKFYKNLPEKFKTRKKFDKEFKKYVLANTLNFFCLSAILYLFPKLAREIGYSTITISNIIGSLLTVRFLTFLILSRLNLKPGEKELFFSYSIAGSSILITGIIKTSILHFISVSILGISSALSFKLVFSEIAKKGYSTEFNETTIGFGWFTGPIFIGFLSNIFGISEGFILTGLFVLMLYFFQKFYFLKTPE